MWLKCVGIHFWRPLGDFFTRTSSHTVAGFVWRVPSAMHIYYCCQQRTTQSLSHYLSHMHIRT
jgi:hypothetical protein